MMSQSEFIRNRMNTIRAGRIGQTSACWLLSKKVEVYCETIMDIVGRDVGRWLRTGRHQSLYGRQGTTTIEADGHLGVGASATMENTCRLDRGAGQRISSG